MSSMAEAIAAMYLAAHSADNENLHAWKMDQTTDPLPQVDHTEARHAGLTMLALPAESRTLVRNCLETLGTLGIKIYRHTSVIQYVRHG